MSGFKLFAGITGNFGAMLGFPVMDSVASVEICLFIVKASYDILKDGVVKLLDTSCGKGYEEQIEQYIAAQEGVVHVDSLCIRMFGNKVYIDLEIQVDGETSLRDAHEIAEQVHDEVERAFPDVKHIMIHLNPDNVTG